MDIWFIAEVDIAVVVLCSVPKSCPALLDPMNWAHQASLSLTVSLSLLRLMSIESECHPNISSSVASFPSCPQSFPASESFPMSQLFASGSQRIGASGLASVLPMNIQGDFLWNWLVWSPCSPRDSQESSPAPQFESISSSALSLLYGPALTSTHDYWKNHSYDCTDLCQPSNVSAS